MKEVVIFGTGGHAKVVYDILLRQNLYKPVAFISDRENMANFLDLPHMHQNKLSESGFLVGIVAIGDNFVRGSMVKFINSQKAAFKFVTAIHPSAQVATDVILEEGVVVMAQCAVNSGTRVGAHVILNTGSLVDHDCKVEAFSSIAPGCTLGGDINMGEYSAISLGAVVKHGIRIGKHTVIGAGALVLEDVDDFKMAYGNPCKVIRTRIQGEKYL